MVMWAREGPSPEGNPFSAAWAESGERRAHDLALAGSCGGRIRLHLRCAGRAFRRREWSKGRGFLRGILRELGSLVKAAWARVGRKTHKV
jgi:hypothetical protein